MPPTLLGRLAIDQQRQGQQLGRILLVDALQRADQAARAVASTAVVVSAGDDDVIAFYERFGFRSFSDTRRNLFLPKRQIARIRRP